MRCKNRLVPNHEYYKILSEIGILDITADVVHHNVMTQTINIQANNKFLEFIELYSQERIQTQEEERMRNSYPTLKKAWLDYQMLIKLCKEKNES